MKPRVARSLMLTTFIFVMTNMNLVAAQIDDIDEPRKNNAIQQAEMAISRCLKEYEKRTGRMISSKVNTVYAKIIDEQIDILFARGEVGDFEERSNDYGAHLFCGLITNNENRLYELFDYDGPPIIWDKTISLISEKKDVNDALYLKFKLVDGSFLFFGIQKYDPKIIDEKRRIQMRKRDKKEFEFVN